MKTISYVTSLGLIGAVLGMSGCGGNGGAAPGVDPELLDGVELELPNGELVEAPAELVWFPNDRDEEIMGVLVRPKTPDTSHKHPAVVVLHGNGGLFTSPDSNDEVLEVAPQFAEWADMLTSQGYVALFPSSYLSRGFFEWHQHPADLDETERLQIRAYDAHAALAYACEHPAVDCSKLALMGFSNGGSGTVLALHEQLEQVPGMEKLAPMDRRPTVALGIAYYPGCGLQELVPMGNEEVDQHYYPSVPLTIHHAQEDPLVDECMTRDAQAQALASDRSLPTSQLKLIVYEDAGHGFDSSPSSLSERTARDLARERVLAQMRGVLGP